MEKNNIEYTSPSTGLLAIIFNSFKPEYQSKEKRREKLVELRTKDRLYKEGKNTNDDFKNITKF